MICTSSSSSNNNSSSSSNNSSSISSTSSNNAIAIAIATTTAAAATTTTTTSATDSTTTITATRPSDISFDSPFQGLSSSQYATTANAATAPLKKGKEKEKALPLLTLALTFSSLIDLIVSLLINNLAFKEIVEYIGLARKLALTQILKEEEKKAVIPIFPSFTS
ncbi:hypothetical protein P8C59_009081 [Phyllachora maydis]|uniref:Uncharacterized protein n=1 Tax=Phyllachora maydis TaxID=1825666 RepID=A0AAD9MKS9_9PEZI|nr:hypothetical protein P8C59_009081 [Phyllachora maydis]